MFRLIPLIKKCIEVSVFFSLFFSHNAFCDILATPTPQAIFDKCNKLNKIGSYGQNKPQMLIGCWKAVNIIYPPDTKFFLLASYLIFDEDGAQYSCVSNQNMAWDTYTDLDKFNMQKLFNEKGQTITITKTYFTLPSLTSQEIIINTGTSGSPQLTFTYVRDISSNYDPTELETTYMVIPNPKITNPNWQTVCKNTNIFSNFKK